MFEELIAKLNATLAVSVSRAKPLDIKCLDGEDFANVKSGTTIAAVNCGVQGVVIGGESRVTMTGATGAARVVNDTFKKLFTIDDSTVLAFAGQVGHGLAIRQYLKYFLGVWRDIYRGVSAKGKVRTLSRVLAQTDAGIMPILAMWDDQHVRDRASGTFGPRGGRLYMLTPDGAYLKLDWTAAGSGADTIRRTLREYCEMVPPNQRSLVEVALMLRYLLVGVGEDDPYSGGNPHIQIVNQSGVLDIVFEHREDATGDGAPPAPAEAEPKANPEGGDAK